MVAGHDAEYHHADGNRVQLRRRLAARPAGARTVQPSVRLVECPVALQAWSRHVTTLRRYSAGSRPPTLQARPQAVSQSRRKSNQPWTRSRRVRGHHRRFAPAAENSRDAIHSVSADRRAAPLEMVSAAKSRPCASVRCFSSASFAPFRQREARGWPRQLPTIAYFAAARGAVRHCAANRRRSRRLKGGGSRNDGAENKCASMRHRRWSTIQQDIGYSSLTAPRRSKAGVAGAANSSSSQPTPTPTVIRPDASAVANIFAVRTGLRCGRINTLVTIRRRSVIAATKFTMDNCSRASP